MLNLLAKVRSRGLVITKVISKSVLRGKEFFGGLSLCLMVLFIHPQDVLASTASPYKNEKQKPINAEAKQHDRKELLRNLGLPGRKPKYEININLDSFLKDRNLKPLMRSKFVPTILSPKDISKYRVIFLLQKEGDWRTVDKIIHSLEDTILLGHVLAQRYLHPTKYRTSYKEFKIWLDKHYDHPEAVRIYRLAVKRRPKNWKMPKAPAAFNREYKKRATIVRRSKEYVRTKKLSKTGRIEMRRLERRLRFFLRKGWTLAYKKLLSDKRLLKLFHPYQLDAARARLAAGYFAAGRDNWALNWAEKAIDRSGQYLPEAHWVAGLAAWRLGNYRKSLTSFEAVSESKYVSSWLSSAGAFWAARSAMKIGKPELYTKYLRSAANFPRTFYGILASYLLGVIPEFDWSSPDYNKKSMQVLANQPGGRRAISLIQVGQDKLAERVLKILFSDSNPELAGAMLAIADRAEMPSLAMRLSSMLVASGKKLLDSTTYPAPGAIGTGSQKIDRELMLAIIRQESEFNPGAKSPRGARGLMQLMPGTASFVGRDRRFRGSRRDRLFDPETNLELGHRYIKILLNEKYIRGDLFKMMVAWNAGPGNLIKWNKSVNYGKDPLLFIESIPSKETRIFVERVMTNYWIYRARFGKPQYSLESVLSGGWPVYKSTKTIKVKDMKVGFVN